jgi:hypothetical protein
MHRQVALIVPTTPTTPAAMTQLNHLLQGAANVVVQFDHHRHPTED